MLMVVRVLYLSPHKPFPLSPLNVTLGVLVACLCWLGRAPRCYEGELGNSVISRFYWFMMLHMPAFNC